MRGSKSLRVVAATVLVVAAAAVVAVNSAEAAPSVVRLHLGTDGKYFEYGSTKQTLTNAPNKCTLNSAEPVIDLSSTGSQSAPGLVTDALGVKGTPSSGNGTPCGQVDSTESLTLKPGTGMTGKSFTGVRLDLEITGNATVKLTLAGSSTAQYQLQTGTSIAAAQASEGDYDVTVPYTVSSSPGDTVDACAAPNSSGPNSGQNDNCQWLVQPGFSFDTITLTTVSAGTVGLEGSGDFASNPDFDTLFYLSNSAPTAVNDSVTTDEDTAVSGNVLTNDSDSDGNPLTATKLTNPAHGTVTFAATGAFTYTPAANYNGSDSFTYSASDGTDSTSATVNIAVSAVNDPPTAQSGTASTDEDEAVTVTIATDIDSSDLTADCTGLAGGSLEDNGDGTVTYTPATNFNGTVTLECTATDDDGATTTSSATILVGVSAVNDPPVAGDDTGEVNQNSNADIDVLANDTDVDGDDLTAGSFGNISPAGSSVAANADGTVKFTPPSGYTGPASFTYKASDGALESNTATVSLTVFQVICSNQTVSDEDGDVIGTFTRLDDTFNCKRYSLDASELNGTVLFGPTGGTDVDYRGFLTFGPKQAPTPGAAAGTFSLLLEYDPTGGSTFRPVQWCVSPVFDADGFVTGATIPPGETWCIASADSRPDANGDVVTTWQVFGHDDPRFR